MAELPSGTYSSKPIGGAKRPHGFSEFGINNYTPEQNQIFRQSADTLGPNSYTARLAKGDESLFAEQEAPALRQFNELQGGMASRFSGMGMGARKSSGFKNTSNAAAHLQRQAVLDMMGMSNQFLNQRPVEKGLVEKPHKESWGDTALKWYQAYQGGSNSGLSGGGNGNSAKYISSAFAGG
jgi:hypothetical protein